MKELRLRPGVHYAPIEGGVYLSSARSTFVMRGPAALFRVLDTCLPLLEDATDVEELLTAIGTPTARRVVTHVLETLDSRGLILHLDQLLVPEPSAAERERFPEALAYLETFRDQPYADFRRIRKAQVVLAGPPEALGPAARGLLRAGVGQVMLATSDPERLAGLASRHPEVRLLLFEGGGIPTLVATRMPHAAVIFTEDSFPAEAVLRLPASCVAIPVRLGKDVAIVGPAMCRGDDPRGAERLWTRSANWSRLDGDELLVRPSGDLLAGALAGQVAFDALIGLNTGRVHLVHGPDLSSDSITPPLTVEATYERPIGFGTRRALTEPSDAGPGSWIDSLSGRWAGLFRVGVPGDLPQMPVALTVADGRSNCFDGRSVGFGPDQETSTNEAALEALRQHCAALQRSRRRESPAGPAVTAAGIDQIRWLLDGALRLLATVPSPLDSGEQALDWVGINDIEARRLWRTLEEHERTPVRISSRRVAGFRWTLISAYDGRTGSLLAEGWGPTAEVGTVAALSATIATLQVRRTIDAGYQPASAQSGFLQHLHGIHLDDLSGAVTDWLAASGCHLRGERLSRDSVAGPIGAWCGTVWLDG